MTQKEISKQYSFLNGRQLQVYIGRVKCPMKHVENELSVNEKENGYGKYTKITIDIQKTHFNGKVITIIPRCFPYMGTLLPFKITPEEVCELHLL